jgi:hypothetical protein
VAQSGDIVGQCLENEWHNAFNGDGLQRTTGGLMAWRKADNWTAYTNGAQTWLNGPCGLQTRPNPEIGGYVFAWEGRVGSPCTGDATVAAPPPQPAPPAPAPPTPVPPGPTATPVPGATATPVPAQGPQLTIQLSDDDIQAGDSVTITIIARDERGIDWIRWEGESAGDNGGDADDPELTDEHEHDCDDVTDCAFVWEVTATVEGDYRIVAEARSSDGRRTEATADLEVR